MKTGFFEEKPGVKSSTRLQMFITLIFSFIVIAYQTYTKEIDHVLVFALLTYSAAPKLIQKFAELKTNSNESGN